VPDNLITEFKVPLEEYLLLLSRSAGYEYNSGKNKSKCDPQTIKKMMELQLMII
jgi:hypothetical protein